MLCRVPDGKLRRKWKGRCKHDTCGGFSSICRKRTVKFASPFPTPRPILGETHSRVPDEIEGIACRSAHHPGRMGGSPFLGRRTAALRMRLRELRVGCPPPRKNGREPILGETHSRAPDEIEGIACRSVHHPGRMGRSPFLGRRTAALRMRLRELRLRFLYFA